ncbi:hypothetical protein GCM10025734_78570 [Kitasatospora paranensis]
MSAQPPLVHHPDWPAVRSAVAPDEQIEQRVEEILRRMTPEEKVGQMIQPELAELTPEDVREYRIGSALNGAGIWPGGDRRATPGDWVKTVDRFWEAAESAYRGRGFRIPFMWATDAVHGHNNVFGATVFPHNIGLGAARDPGCWSGSARRPPGRSPPPAWTGRSPRPSPRRATAAGAATTRGTRRTRRWCTATPRRWCAACRAPPWTPA